MLIRQATVGRTTLLLALLASFALVEAHVRWRGGPPIDISWLSVFACFGYASIACHYLLSPGRAASRSLVIVLAAVIVGAALMLAAVGGGDLVWPAKWALAALGALGVAAYVRDAALAGRIHERRERLLRLRDALVVPVAVVQTPMFLWTNASINPVYDARVYAFEDKLGVPFSYLAVHSYRLLDPASAVATACYLAAPVAIAVLALKQRPSHLATRVLFAAVLASVCGFALYALCPVVGPVMAFAAPSPARLPALALVDIVPFRVANHVPRNGMPSLHTAWALLLVFNSARFDRWWRSAFVAFALMSVWAAMGRYDHWFMDLVVAVPLAAAVQIAIVGGRRRWATATVCAVLTLAWIAGLREGWFLGSSTWLAWLTVALTVAAPLWFVAASYPKYVEQV